jgi:hypothetical protein
MATEVTIFQLPDGTYWGSSESTPEEYFDAVSTARTAPGEAAEHRQYHHLLTASMFRRLNRPGVGSKVLA